MTRQTGRLTGWWRTGFSWQTGLSMAVLALIACACAILAGQSSLAGAQTLSLPQSAATSHSVTVVLPERTVQLGVGSGIAIAAFQRTLAAAKLSVRIYVAVRAALDHGWGGFLACLTTCLGVGLLSILFASVKQTRKR